MSAALFIATKWINSDLTVYICQNMETASGPSTLVWCVVLAFRLDFTRVEMLYYFNWVPCPMAKCVTWPVAHELNQNAYGFTYKLRALDAGVNGGDAATSVDVAPSGTWYDSNYDFNLFVFNIFGYRRQAVMLLLLFLWKSQQSIVGRVQRVDNVTETSIGRGSNMK